VDEPREISWKIVPAALLAPLILVVVLPLAALAAVGFYLLAIAQAFWLLCRALPCWLSGSRREKMPRQPHFLETHTRSGLPD
jgi:hypothetical protein